jgi:hypothetical protein
MFTAEEGAESILQNLEKSYIVEILNRFADSKIDICALLAESNYTIANNIRLIRSEQ